MTLFTTSEAALGSLLPFWSFFLLTRLMVSVISISVVILILVSVVRPSVSVIESIPYVVSEQRWTVFLFNDVFGVAPEDDRNATFSSLFIFREGIDSMFPSNIYVSAKRK